MKTTKDIQQEIKNKQAKLQDYKKMRQELDEKGAERYMMFNTLTDYIRLYQEQIKELSRQLEHPKPSL